MYLAISTFFGASAADDRAGAFGIARNGDRNVATLHIAIVGIAVERSS
jgi:hypothetical protein